MVELTQFLPLTKIKKPRANSPTTLGINILKTYKLTNKLIWGSLFVKNVNVIYKLHRNPVSKRIVEYFSLIPSSSISTDTGVIRQSFMKPTSSPSVSLPRCCW